MASDTKSGVNPVLLLVMGVLVGFVAGYVVGGGSGGGGLAQSTPVSTQACPNELPASDNWIIEGFICPAVACADPLLACHCETAHQIKNDVKGQLAQGLTGQQVRDNLIEQWGDALR